MNSQPQGTTDWELVDPVVADPVDSYPVVILSEMGPRQLGLPVAKLRARLPADLSQLRNWMARASSSSKQRVAAPLQISAEGDVGAELCAEHSFGAACMRETKDTVRAHG